MVFITLTFFFIEGSPAIFVVFTVALLWHVFPLALYLCSLPLTNSLSFYFLSCFLSLFLVQLFVVNPLLPGKGHLQF